MGAATAFGEQFGDPLALASPGPKGPANFASPEPLIADRPRTIPALQAWVPLPGTFSLTSQSRIVIPGPSSIQLASEATQLAADLGALLGRSIPIDNQPKGAAQPGDIVLELGSPDSQLGSQGYFLVVGSTFTISAPTAAGLFYGGRTLLQLLHQGPQIPRGLARDWSVYPERGLMLDLVTGTDYTLEWLQSEIQRLAYLKLNVLHLHFTDDGGWGIECDSYPALSTPNALTKSEIRELIAFASRYHVMVIPEIEILGHMGAFMKVFPQLELKLADLVDSTNPSEYVTDKLDITNPDALLVIQKLLEEYLPLFPGPYWHMGGDEYLSPAEIPVFPQLGLFALETYGPLASVPDAIHGYMNWVNRIVRGHGKTLRVWNDQLGGTVVVRVDPNVIVEWWTNISPFSDPVPVAPGTLIAQGHKLLNAGWYPTYYSSNIGPEEGMSNMQEAYEGWQVNQFYGSVNSSEFQLPPQVVPSDDPAVLGSTINVWTSESVAQTQAGIAPRLAVIAQKCWSSTPLTDSYPVFEAIMNDVGS
jgi:hexosaminidase